ncbi:hypothetical protein ASE01_14950 [Nocardioides sp. Root190]|uniref:ABC transporter permease n=1 Tax=Nocardioides sp. Root190 TaxID=1736488 RepID=UPI0006F243D0|nr:ABC transporter permease [Nocardioides sp. Root190]KRB76296.1 hypothetical protein ASE01_14950 [Nocardioides sp. Root190]
MSRSTGRTASTRGGWRIALRLARREAMRRKGQTLLMLVLICLPVVAVGAASIVWRTQDVSSVEGLDRRMGAADAYVETSGFGEVVQAFDPSENYGVIGEDDVFGGPDTLGTADLDAVLDVIGADRPAVPLRTSSLSYRTDEGLGNLETLTSDLASSLTDGLLTKVRGTYPPGPGEVVVNQALADRGPGIGDTLTVVRQTGEGEQQIDLRIVGIAERTTTRGYPMAAGLPGAFGADGPDEMGQWLIGGGPVSWDEVQALNAVGVLASSRAVLTDLPPASELSPELPVMDSGIDEVTLTVLALVAAMVLLEVVLLAGPAFAVRAKAQAHSLALVAAAGGTPRQARRTVLASGVVIGVVGGVLGVALAVAVGTVAVPVAQRFDSTRFGPFEVPWPLLALVAAFGFLSAVLAAVVPAFSSSRQDVVAVLAGRRGEGKASVRSPILGLVLLGVGIAGAVAGAGAGGDGGGSAAILIAGSAIVSVLGMILLVPMAVGLVARMAGRLPLALRFAARDAARHRTRTVPAVAAVGATVAGVVTLGIALASQEAANEDRYVPMLPAGYGSVTLGDSDQTTVMAILDRNLPEGRSVTVRGALTSTDDGELEMEFRDGEDVLSLSYWSALSTPYVVVSEVPDYLEIIGGDRAELDATLAAGGMVLLDDENQDDLGAIPDVGRLAVDVRRWDPEGGEPELVGTTEVDAAVAKVEGTSPAVAFLSPEVVEQLGMEVGDVGAIIPGPISSEAQQDIDEALAALGTSPYFYVERGYQTDPAVRIIQAVLALLGGILMLGGTLTATFLALSDARPDLATMAAVGARPRTRRGVAASYALVVGGVGALLGAPVGLIPGFAISRPLTRHWETGATSLDVPWLLIAVVVIGLPLLTAGVVAVCARGRLPLTARID